MLKCELWDDITVLENSNLKKNFLPIFSCCMHKQTQDTSKLCITIRGMTNLLYKINADNKKDR